MKQEPQKKNEQPQAQKQGGGIASQNDTKLKGGAAPAEKDMPKGTDRSIGQTNQRK